MTQKEIKAEVRQEITLAKEERKSLKGSVRSLIANAVEGNANLHTLCVLCDKNFDSIATTDEAVALGNFTIKGVKKAITESFPLIEKLDEGGVCFLSVRARYFGTCAENVKKVFTPVVINDYLHIIEIAVKNRTAHYVDTCNHKKHITAVPQTEAHVDTYYTDKTCTKVFDTSNMTEYKKTKEGYAIK